MPTDDRIARWLDDGRRLLEDVARPPRLWEAIRDGLATGPQRARVVLGLIAPTREALIDVSRHLASRTSRVVTSLAGWSRAFLDRLAAGHVAAAMAALATPDPAPADLAVAAAAIGPEARRIEKFRAALAAGTVALWAATGTGPAIAAAREISGGFEHRSGMYAGGLWGGAQRVARAKMGRDGFDLERRVLGDVEGSCEDCPREAGRGWVPFGTLPEIGETRCGGGCRCHFEFMHSGTARILVPLPGPA